MKTETLRLRFSMFADTVRITKCLLLLARNVWLTQITNELRLQTLPLRQRE